MTDFIARVCDSCGHTDTIANHADSNGMVIVQSDRATILLMRDIRRGEICRPSFDLTDKAFCPECLIKAIKSWLEKVK